MIGMAQGGEGVPSEDGLEPEPEDQVTETLDLTLEEADDLVEAEAKAFQVVYSGQDFDIHGLVRRLNDEHILIPHYGVADDRILAAGFQRAFVWTRSQMDRFIESVLLGYPIPGIFLVKQLSDNRYLVLDGQQRLTTLQRFHEGVHDGREFVLRNVADEFKGLTYKTLPDDLRRQFDDTFIQATLVNSDGSSESLEAVYQIFERLNSGGTQLTPHEIRVALFAGELVTFVARINEGAAWRALYGPPSRRLRDHELILRVMALFMESETYRRPLKTFLNQFVLRHRGPMANEVAATGALFVTASELLMDGPGPDALRSRGRQLNAALTEAVLVGLMTRLTDRPIDAQQVASAVGVIRANPELMESVSRSTADEDFVRRRIAISRDAFLTA